MLFLLYSDCSALTETTNERNDDDDDDTKANVEVEW